MLKLACSVCRSFRSSSSLRIIGNTIEPDSPVRYCSMSPAILALTSSRRGLTLPDWLRCLDLFIQVSKEQSFDLRFQSRARDTDARAAARVGATARASACPLAGGLPPRPSCSASSEMRAYGPTRMGAVYGTPRGSTRTGARNLWPVSSRGCGARSERPVIKPAVDHKGWNLIYQTSDSPVQGRVRHGRCDGRAEGLRRCAAHPHW